MFGYVTVNRPEIKVKDLELYRSYYCGLCHALHERYGRRGQLFLSYDGTFLAILLTALYEPEEDERTTRCIIHPVAAHKERASRYTQYAADMNVMLAYRKALDDWRDERSRAARTAALLLHRDYCRIRERWQRQEKALSENIRALHRMEAADGAWAGKLEKERRLPYQDRLSGILEGIDRAAGFTGNFFGEICVPHRDHWERDLRQTGFYLGKFIYLMDAYDDLPKDAEKGNFNVLAQLKDLEGEHFEKTLKEILLDTAAHCCRSFERLPIVKDVELMRNILYSGIWARFWQIQNGETDRKKRGVWCADARQVL